MKTGVGDAVIETARSACSVGSTRIVVSVVLLDGVGSVVCEVIVAEFSIEVSAATAAPTVILIWIGSAVVLAPLASATLYVHTTETAFTAHVQLVVPPSVTLETVVFVGIC